MKKRTSKGKSIKAAKPRTGAQCVVDSLIDAGCEVLFGYPGGAVLDIFNCIYDAPLHFVLTRHEQGAAHMADGYARATGKPGCCLVTSGPGATNTVTALATAYMDGIPMVCITGQVAMNMIGNDAFQEADVTGITRPVTKYNFLVRNVDELPDIIAQAFYIATTGKPGPVVVDIPKDIQKQTTMAVTPAKVSMRAYKPDVEVVDAEIQALAQMINDAERPLLYVGGGVIAANATGVLKKLAHKAGIPVCTTLMGLGAFPEDDPLSLEMLGMHGTVAANFAANECDLLIAAGSRFTDRVTGKVSHFAPRAKIVHIDIDISSISKSKYADLGIHGDVGKVLQAVLPKVKKKSYPEWMAQINKWQEEFPLTYKQMGDALMPEYVIERINKFSQGKAIIATDVGQHQMWAAQYCRFIRPRTSLTSGGLGTMGFGLPASIGAQFGCPDDLVVCITGDGGVQMNFQELVVAVEHNLPLVVVIINNCYLGMVRQWQELFYARRYAGVSLGMSGRAANERIKEKEVYLPDLIKLAEAHGAHARRVTTADELDEALKEAFKRKATWVIECIVEAEANVYPMIPPGTSVKEMIKCTV